MKLELIKEFIKDNRKVEKVFYTGIKEKTLEEKFEYIKSHYTYDVMNSWNGLRSIANNVKVWHLNLSKKQENTFFELLDIDNDYIYDFLSVTINDFEELTDTDIFFNESQGGHLIIIPDFNQYKQRMDVLDLFFDDNIYYYDTFKEFKKESLDTDYGKSNKDINNDLEECYYLLKSFDLLCDVLREELIYILDNAKIKEKTKTIQQAYKYIEVE